MSFTVTYNGVTDQSIGCHAKSRPSIPAPVPKVQTTELRGMDGSYYMEDGTYNDISIIVTFSLNSSDHSNAKAKAGEWMTLYRAVKKWLFSSGNGHLQFSDDYDLEPDEMSAYVSYKRYYYKVKSVSLATTRITRMLGEVTATFICDGYNYRVDGDIEEQVVSSYVQVDNMYQPSQVTNPIVNNFDTCHPLYRIEGSGTITLKVNDKSFTVTSNLFAYIDTDKMITYNADGEWVNITAQGDYEDLWLQPGNNKFQVVYNNAEPMYVYMTPRWRCL